MVIFSFQMFSLAQETVKLPNSTLVVVKTQDELSGEELKVGQQITCLVGMDVKVKGKLLIKAGAPVFCKVENAEETGMVGAGGELSISAQYTTAVDGTNIQLTGNFIAKGDSDTGESVGLAVILCPLFLLQTGDEAVVPAGAEIRAFTIGEYEIELVDE